MTKLTDKRRARIVELFIAGESVQRIGYLYEQPVGRVEDVIRTALKQATQKGDESAKGGDAKCNTQQIATVISARTEPM